MVFVSGFIIFMNFFVVFKFMWMSIWRSEFYTAIGYVLFYSCLHMYVSGLMGIVCTFICLRYGHYKWQWRSFWVGATSVLYVYVYTTWYQTFHLDMKLMSDDLIYCLWTNLFLIAYMVFTGACSTLATTVFINLIYRL